MIINNPFKGAFGMDIGDSTIKIVQLSKKWRPNNKSFFEISDIRQIKLPEGAIISGEIIKSDIVVQKIQQLLSPYEKIPAIKSPWTVVSLPVIKSFLKLIKSPAPIEQLDDNIIQAEVIKHLPWNISEIKIDWQIINNYYSDKNDTMILIGAVPKKTINSFVDLIKKANLKPLALEIEDLSIARSMITANKTYKNEARAILDLGGSRSSMIIYDNGSIQFSSIIDFSGDIIDLLLAKKLGIDKQAVNKLKINHGLNYVDQYPDYLKTMVNLADMLSDNILKKIKFYNDHFIDANPITHITMSGGVSILKNLDKYITEKIKIEACPGNIWKNLFNKKITQKDKTSLSFASAVGLALRATEWPLGKK